MISPSEVKAYQSTRYSATVTSLQKSIDKALQNHDFGRWPVYYYHFPNHIPAFSIEEIKEGYISAGWIVTDGLYANNCKCLAFAMNE